ncbi:MAG: sporulation integral membrane protein YlbJ [Clostridium sp.]|nr:sporulation integral membrane protein YlbJ [Clostridium sp.]
MFSIIFLWLLIIFLLFILFKLINPKKNYIICFFISILIIIFFINLSVAMKAAIEGCKLWFNAILPTLLPFLVICNLLISYDGINLYSKILGPILCRPLGLPSSCSFPLTASILCGYPLGAKYCSDIYNLGYIDKDEYTRLLNIATNCGPLFIIGPVATAMLGNISLSYILLIANYSAPILIGFIFKKRKCTKEQKNKEIFFSSNTKNFGENFKNALENSINTTLSIGGFIIIFSVIISIIKNNATINIVLNNITSFFNFPENSLNALFLGSIEITNGCNILASSNITLPFKLACISFLCSFSGLCIIAQVSSFVSKDKISLLRYSIIKFFQGILSFFITLILASSSLISINTSSTYSLTNASSNIFIFFLPLVILLALTLILSIIRKSLKRL